MPKNNTETFELYQACLISYCFLVAFIVHKDGIFLFRKRTLMLNNILAISGAIFLGLTKHANSVALLIVGRILVGVNAGE